MTDEQKKTMSTLLQEISKSSNQASRLLTTCSAAISAGDLPQLDGELLNVLVEKFQLACEEAEEVLT